MLDGFLQVRRGPSFLANIISKKTNFNFYV